MPIESQTPPWVPQIEKGSRILIVGASGGIGRAVVEMLAHGPQIAVGLHSTHENAFDDHDFGSIRHMSLVSHLNDEKDCNEVVDQFCEQSGGIDHLVVLCGGVARSCHWRELNERDWHHDINLNLSIPFFLSRRAMEKIDHVRDCSIVLTGTESSLHGGSPTSFPYGVAKRGIECLVQGLAREGASHGITVNGVRLGFIESGFHKRWLNKSSEDIEKRIKLIPLRRAGTTHEAAALIIFLLSAWARFITGQMFALTGGDWL